MADTAVTIVDEIIADLSARSGLGSEWDQTDKDIRDEIRTEWLDIVSSAVKVRDFEVAKAERSNVLFSNRHLSRPGTLVQASAAAARTELLSLATTTWQTVVAANGGIPVDESTDSVAREIVRHCRLLISEVDQPTRPARRRSTGAQTVPAAYDDAAGEGAEDDHAEHLEYDE